VRDSGETVECEVLTESGQTVLKDSGEIIKFEVLTDSGDTLKCEVLTECTDCTV